uniref:Dual specificity protein phosphatase DSP8 n=1 Tax=Nicotiana tabacum TaxID=4097 RepID=A0A1S4A9A7_TOBAC|nr:PREDICTED: putative dual specificity protein phosphatase DSP8 [Nicotiana tabacum]
MYIEEEKGGELESREEVEEVVSRVVEKAEKSSAAAKVLSCSGSSGKNAIVVLDVRRVMVGVGARALFYPTLLYNVVRNKIQVEFRWWDWIDEFVLLGAVPFQSDVKRLKELGVSGVVTLNEPYETLVPTSLYEAHDIRHLVLPTRDYLFAPSLHNICQAVEFIHGEYKSHPFGFPLWLFVDFALLSKILTLISWMLFTFYHDLTVTYQLEIHLIVSETGTTSTVSIISQVTLTQFKVKYKQMTPNDAYNYVKSIRPRVLLASSQRQAVEEFYHLMMKRTYSCSPLTSLISRSSRFLAGRNLLAFDDGAVVVITEADLDGYDQSLHSRVDGSEIWADLNLIYRVRVAGGAALTRLSCMWFRCHDQKIPTQKLTAESKQVGSFTVDIHVFS